jgi:hypothetical protein
MRLLKTRPFGCQKPLTAKKRVKPNPLKGHVNAAFTSASAETASTDQMNAPPAPEFSGPEIGNGNELVVNFIILDKIVMEFPLKELRQPVDSAAVRFWRRRGYREKRTLRIGPGNRRHDEVDSRGVRSQQDRRILHKKRGREGAKTVQNGENCACYTSWVILLHHPRVQGVTGFSCTSEAWRAFVTPLHLLHLKNMRM